MVFGETRPLLDPGTGLGLAAERLDRSRGHGGAVLALDRTPDRLASPHHQDRRPRPALRASSARPRMAFMSTALCAPHSGQAVKGRNFWSEGAPAESGDGEINGAG